MSEEELKDQSKGDLLVKCLTMVQSIYLALQLIVRYKTHQPSSQLEIVVVAFAVCSFITHCLLLSKPQDVQTARFIKARFYPTANQMLALADSAPKPLATFEHLDTRSYAISNLSYHADKNQQSVGAFMGASIGASIIFGSLHCIAWNFVFPTNNERVLRRAAALLTILILSVSLLLTIVSFCQTGSIGMSFKARKETVNRSNDRILGFLITEKNFMVVALSAYVLARLYVIVEVFHSLFFLPPEAFKTTAWPSAFLLRDDIPEGGA